MATSKNKMDIKVGQWVLVPYSPEPARAKIIEDRGNLGVDGERIFTVLVPLEEGIEREYEIPESALIGAA